MTKNIIRNHHRFCLIYNQREIDYKAAILGLDLHTSKVEAFKKRLNLEKTRLTRLMYAENIFDHIED